MLVVISVSGFRIRKHCCLVFEFDFFSKLQKPFPSILLDSIIINIMCCIIASYIDAH